MMHRVGVFAGLALSLTLLASPNGAQEHKAHAFDDSGKGAVLCAYEIYVGVQQVTKLCGLSRTESDDALDQGIAAMGAFIAENATDPWTANWIREVERRGDPDYLSAEDIARACMPHTSDTPAKEFTDAIRSRPAADIHADFADMLSIPREPVRNPCL